MSALGNGATLAFLGIYFSMRLHLGAGFVGPLLAVSAAFTMISAPVGGILADRIGDGRVAGAACLIQAMGFAGLAMLPSGLWLVAWQALVGLGNGLFFPSWRSYFGRTASEAQYPQGWALLGAATGAMNGAGAVIGGWLLQGGSGIELFGALLWFDVATFLGMALYLVLAPASVRQSNESSGAGSDRFESSVWTSPIVIRLSALQFATVFVMAAVDAGIPLLAVRRLGVGLAGVGLLMAIETADSLILQVPAGRLLADANRASVLASQGAIWATGWLIAATSMFFSGTVAWALLAGGMLLSGVGYTCHGAAFGALVTEAVPESTLGQTNGVLSTAYSSARMLGPAVAVPLALAGTAAGYWAVLVGMSATIAVLAVSLRGESAAGPVGLAVPESTLE